MKSFFLLVLVAQFFLAQGAFANPAPVHSLSVEEAAREAKQNEWARQSAVYSDSIPVRPYAEYEKAQYVVFNHQFSYEAGTIKEAIAKNLPKDVELIVTVRSESDAAVAQSRFSQLLSADRIHTVITPYGDTFWARDTSPEAVFSSASGDVSLVETQHRQGGEIAPLITNYLNLPLINNQYAYPGGNFLTDARGNCFSVETPVPDQDMRALYGCKKTTRFPFAHGIGHVDETLKVLSDTLAFTDVPSYAPALKALGYEVQILPRPSNNLRGTYANSLLINGSVFLPIYGAPEDQTAIRMYEKQGLKVYPLRSDSLSGTGQGSIHCITMSYPPIDRNYLLNALK